MGFEGLLGNERLKENLRVSAGKGRLSHFYLICGPKGSGKHTLAQLLAAAAVCRQADKPCLQCKACRKVLSGNHPDVITVTDPEHKEIPISLVRQCREDMFIRPNEADKKIYIFAQSIRVEGQNALLKVLEEPPAYGICLLLSENPEALLPTIRSRCVELKLQPLGEGLLKTQLRQSFPQLPQADIDAAAVRSGGYLGQAVELLESGAQVSEQTRAFADSFTRRDALALTWLLVPMEKWKRDQLIPELEQWVNLLHSALLCRSGAQVTMQLARDIAAQRGSREIMEAIGQLKKAMEYAAGNVSVGAICGYLSWVLR